MKIKTVNRVEIAKAAQDIGISVSFEWITPTEEYRLITKRWFTGTFGPSVQKHLRSLKSKFGTLEHNPSKPGWNCYFQCLEGMSFAKVENARVGGNDHNIAIGIYGFDRPPGEGHMVLVGFYGDCKPVFWDITYAGEYDLSRDDGLNGRILLI